MTEHLYTNEQWFCMDLGKIWFHCKDLQCHEIWILVQCRKEHQSKIFFALCNLLVSIKWTVWFCRYTFVRQWMWMGTSVMTTSWTEPAHTLPKSWWQSRCYDGMLMIEQGTCVIPVSLNKSVWYLYKYISLTGCLYHLSCHPNVYIFLSDFFWPASCNIWYSI